jgi:hypothetical protein
MYAASNKRQIPNARAETKKSNASANRRKKKKYQ